MSEILTVRQSVDGRAIVVEGTQHSLELLGYLIQQLCCSRPIEPDIIEARSPSDNVSIRVVRVPAEGDRLADLYKGRVQ